jgi:DNA-binding beta-propeller fold protein YncE
MDETSLRAHFERAVSDRPPAPHLVARARVAGLRLRKRRRIEAAAASVTAVALIAAIPAAAGALGPGLRAQHPVGDSWTPASAPNAFVWTSANTVTPIRLSTDTTLRPLRFPGVIAGLQAAPDGSAVYVFSATSPSRRAAGTSYITRVSASTGQMGPPVRLTGPLSAWLSWSGNAAMTAEIAPGDRIAYATELPGGLEAINLATGAERKVAVSGQFATTADGRKAYITDAGLIPVDLVTGTQLPPVQLHVPGQTRDVAIAPDGKTAYVTNLETNGAVNEHITTWVTPVNVATDTAGRAFVGQSVNSQLVTANISIAPDGMTGYLWGADVVPIDLATSRAETPIRLDPAIRAVVSNFVISPDSQLAYAQLLGQHWLQPVDLASGAALRPVELPPGFAGTAAVTFSEDGTVAYVGGTARRHGLAVGAIVPIDTASQRAGPPIAVEGSPEQIVIVP